MNRNLWLIAGAAAGLALLMAAYWQFLYRPLARHVEVRRQELGRQQQELDEARRLMEHFEKFQSQAEQSRMRLQRWQTRLPETPHIPSLLTAVAQAATACKVREFRFEPQAAVARGGYWEQPIKVTVACSYHALGQLATQLASLPQLASTTDYQIEGRDQTGRGDSLRAEFMLVAYGVKKNTPHRP